MFSPSQTWPWKSTNNLSQESRTLTVRRNVFTRYVWLHIQRMAGLNRALNVTNHLDIQCGHPSNVVRQRKAPWHWNLNVQGLSPETVQEQPCISSFVRHVSVVFVEHFAVPLVHAEYFDVQHTAVCTALINTSTPEGQGCTSATIVSSLRWQNRR